MKELKKTAPKHFVIIVLGFLLCLSLVSCGMIASQETEGASSSQAAPETESAPPTETQNEETESTGVTDQSEQSEQSEQPKETEPEIEVPHISWTPLLFDTMEEYEAWLEEETDLPSNFVTFDQISWLGEFTMFSEHGGPYGYTHQAYRYDASNNQHDLSFSVREAAPSLTNYTALSCIEGDLRKVSSEHASAYHEQNGIIYLYRDGMLSNIYFSANDLFCLVYSPVSTQPLPENGFSDYPITGENADSIIARLLHSDTAEGAVAEIIQGLTKENP